MFRFLRKPTDPNLAGGVLADARRNLVLLSAVAVAGTIVAALAGVVASSWPLAALQDTLLANRALRAHAEAHMAHDMLRADVFAHAAGLAQAHDEFEDHARQLEDNLQELEAMPLPPQLRARVVIAAVQLRSYAAAGRRLMEHDARVTSERLAEYSALWRALEQPLDAIRDELQGVLAEAELSGRRGRTGALVATGLGLLVLLGLVTLSARRLSGAVLQANRQLANATAKALQASESRADFLASMSHEIRTPMTGVLGMIDLMAQDNLTSRQRREYVGALRASGQHLLAVINDILDFTRIESGKLELEQLDFALGDVLEQIRSLVHFLAVERGLQFDLLVEEGVPAVLRGDPTRLRQVLLNLCSNAVKFTESGQVRVRVAADRQHDGPWRLRFEVRDTGVGIPPDRIPRLFDPFRQADQSISRRYGGSGLGLAISQRLVDAMGGTIGGESTPGVGSTFFFELPLAEGDPQKLRGSIEGVPVTLRPRRILVAEDVEINRQILRRGLERAGHDPVFANDGAAAVQLATREPFDLVLMDVQMPVMDGVEATRRIRALANGNSGVPILALTANVMAQERDRYLSAGMDACLTKPIEWDQLFAAIEHHTAGPADAQALEDHEEQQEQAAPVQDPHAPLVDEAIQSTLLGMAGRERLAEWVQIGMRSYEAGCDAVAAAGVAADAVAAEAHRIKGSAGTLGLARLQSAAGHLEHVARAGACQPQQVEQLRAVLAQTREALRTRGLL